MRFRGGEFSTGTTGNFQPELTPEPFRPFDRPNLEMYGDRKSRDAWRAAVNRQLDKAKALYGPDSDRDERELN